MCLLDNQKGGNMFIAGYFSITYVLLFCSLLLGVDWEDFLWGVLYMRGLLSLSFIKKKIIVLLTMAKEGFAKMFRFWDTSRFFILVFRNPLLNWWIFSKTFEAYQRHLILSWNATPLTYSTTWLFRFVNVRGLPDRLVEEIIDNSVRRSFAERVVLRIYV